MELPVQRNGCKICLGYTDAVLLERRQRNPTVNSVQENQKKSNVSEVGC